MNKHSPLPWPTLKVVAREIRRAMLDNPSQELPFNNRAKAREIIANEAAEVILARFAASNAQLVAVLKQVLQDDREFRCCSSVTLEAIETALAGLKESV